MRWIVGLDLQAGGDGPLQLASWVRRFGLDEEEVRAVHVIPTRARIHAFMRSEQLEWLYPEVREACGTRLHDAGGLDAIAGVQLIESDSVEDALCAAALGLSADALIVGRRARRGQEGLVRLGRITRRLLRRLPVPVVVVPPDFDAGEPADAPVVLATDCRDHSVPAGRFAETLARALDCELLVAHVVPGLDWAQDPMLGAAKEATRLAADEAGRAELASWASVHALWGARTTVLHGDPPRELAALARSERAALVVCGSRGLSLAARAISASMASELAACAGCAVAVVPPGPVMAAEIASPPVEAASQAL